MLLKNLFSKLKKKDNMEVVEKAEEQKYYSNNFNVFKNNEHEHEHKEYLDNLNSLYTNIYYELDTEKGCVIKNFFKKELFDWELFIILMIEKAELRIIPEITNINYDNGVSFIEYNTIGLCSIRDIFENKEDINFHLMINELLVFIKKIRMKNIIIGNLHIDSIYVNLDKMEFFILDLSNTYFKKLGETTLDLQSLYISMNDLDMDKNVLNYFNKELNRLDKQVSKYSYISELINSYKF